MNSTTQSTILGIDPGTKEMGLAVLRGSELLAYGVRTLRNGDRPYDVIGQARRIVLETIEQHEPEIVAIEKPLMLPTKRAAILSVIAQELRARAEELNLEVVKLSPEEVRQAVVGNPRATKIDVAERLVREFEQLRGLVPKRPARAALGVGWRERYWLHMFEALGQAAPPGWRWARCAPRVAKAVARGYPGCRAGDSRGMSRAAAGTRGRDRDGERARKRLGAGWEGAYARRRQKESLILAWM